MSESENSKKAKPSAASTVPTVKITLTRSLIGRPDKQRRVARALGLKKMHQSVTLPQTDTIRGMINRIPHLLTVEAS